MPDLVERSGGSESPSPACPGPAGASPATVPARPVVRVRFFAAARAAVGVPELDMGGTAGLAGIVAELSSRGEPVAGVIARCRYLVDQSYREPTTEPLPPGTVVDVLPPFAGG